MTPTDDLAGGGQTFASWADRDRAAAKIVAEAYGYGRSVDLSDDAALLSWARTYLPMVLEHGQSAVIAPATKGGA